MAKSETQPLSENFSVRKYLLTNPLALVAAAFGLQLLTIVFLSFLQQRPVFFIAPGPLLGWDYHAFYWAAQIWLRGGDPYSVTRFVTPPPSLVPGLLFAAFPFPIARLCFLALNVAIVIFSLTRLAKYLDLAPTQRFLLVAITVTYYPFFSVVERGNVDGLALGGLILAEVTQSPIVRALSISIIAGLKVYPAVLTAALARRKDLRTLLYVIVLTLASLLPFARYVRSFIVSVLSRADRFQFNENFSPASLFRYSGVPGWKIIFVGFWCVTILIFLFRSNGSNRTLVAYVPWMTSMPSLVLSHSGILYLPLLAVLARNVRNRSLTTSEWLLTAGVLLTGLQAVPLGFLFSEFHVIWELLYLCAPIGTTLIILSVCAGALDSSPA